jgi:hypothetical protein
MDAEENAVAAARGLLFCPACTAEVHRDCFGPDCDCCGDEPEPEPEPDDD